MTGSLKAEQLDDVARTVLALAREVWVLRDRQRVLETVLAEKGMAVSEAIETHQPAPELAQALEAERKAFVDALMQALVPSA